MIQTPLRQRLDLSTGWEFVKGRVRRGWLAGRTGAGEVVDLPHSWNAFDTYQAGRKSYSGRGAYRRGFGLPRPEGDAGILRLYSEGFYGVGEIWIDGKRIADFDAQYLGFDIDLPEEFSTGEHVLAIRLDNRYRPNVLPGKRDPDFILHGGVAGRVFLERRTAVRLSVSQMAVTKETVDEGGEELSLHCAVVNQTDRPVNGIVRWVVSDPTGFSACATQSESFEAAAASLGSGLVSAIVLDRPKCWSPDSPHLYWAECRLIVDDMVIDAARIRFGITRAEFRPREGFFLDGARVDLHGCNRHEALPGFGNALPDALQRRDAHIMHQLGCNFVRLSHYPQSPTFIDACDELGILVYAEIASWKSVRSSRGWRRAARRQMHDLIIRDRHHPSVILWGMGNESRSRKAYRELRSIARELDPARPVIYAENHLYRARREKTIGIPDVWGVNYELDVLQEARDSSRLENVILSECCNHPMSIKGDERQELTQVATLEREWEVMDEHPWIAGHAVWGLTDYATEHRNRYRRQNGLLDAWRGPKMAAELFRARYAAAPFVSIFVTQERVDLPTSKYRKEHSPEISGGGLLLHVFSNCESVRLTRDGSYLAVLEGALHHVVEIDDRFQEIIATGSRGEVMDQQVYRRHDAATRIEITTTDRATAGAIVTLDVSIRDRSGVKARNWNGHLQIASEGDARMIPYTEAGDVLMARGEGRAYLEVGRSSGLIMIRAAGDGLDPGFLTLSDS